MKPHVHMSPIHALVMIALTVAIFGTIHLLCLTNDNKFSRAWIALGF